MKKPALKRKPGNSYSMKVSLDDLEKTAKEFQKAGDETNAILNRLEKSVKDLEDSWDDAGQQIFYKYYQDWHSHIVVISQLLDMAANELNAIAERYHSADNDPAG